MTVTIFLGSLLAAMALGMPIAYALLVSGAALMWHLNMFDAQILAQNVVNGADSFPLLAVPFFMLAGEIMNVGGLSRRIVNLALALVGHLRGGLGYVTILAAVLMAALSGSAVADTAALAALLLPMMVRAGHDPARAGGLIASAGIIAPVIPPSIGFVIFGVAANLSIGKLFMAGIVPGILLGAGIAQALGAAVAHPGQPVCCIIGDGALGFHPQEIETAVRNRLRVIVLVVCDKQWGMVKMNQQFTLKPLKTMIFKSLGPDETIKTDLGEIEFDKLAQAMGAHGERVADPAQLRPAIERALACGGPAVIHVDVDPVKHMWAPGLMHFKDMHLEPKGK